jgi:hypothetical protein
VTAEKKARGLAAAGDTGFGADGWAAVLLVTASFFAWRFRLPRDSGILAPGPVPGNGQLRVHQATILAGERGPSWRSDQLGESKVGGRLNWR